MNKDTCNNDLIWPIYELYDALLDIDNSADSYMDEKPKKKSIFKRIRNFLFGDNDEIVPKHKEVIEALDNIIRLEEDIINKQIPFERIWNFCEFVRVMEKLFFYPNKPENDIYVEMNMNDWSAVRKMKMSVDDNSEIRFTLEHSVLNSDILSIFIIREYGLNMNTTYKVVNEDIQYNDSSDLYMINEVNRLLKASMISTIHSVTKYIVKVYKYKLSESDLKLVEELL